MDIEIRPLTLVSDRRGWLLKVLMRQDLPADDLPFGEIYLSASIHRAVKGNHYHEHTTEWFCPLAGRGVVHLLDLETRERREVVLDAAAPVRLRIPPGVAHAIAGLGDEPFVVLAYADLPYDAAKPDTIACPVLPEGAGA